MGAESHVHPQDKRHTWLWAGVGGTGSTRLENSRKHLSMGFQKNWDFWMGGRNQELVGVQYSWGRDLPQQRAAGARGGRHVGDLGRETCNKGFVQPMVARIK